MRTSAGTSAPDLVRVSPELALVDPELAQRLRRRMPRKRLGHRPPLPILKLAGVSERGTEAARNETPHEQAAP